MKICLVTDNFHPNAGGQFTSLHQISIQLKKKKIKFIILHKQSKILSNTKKMNDILSSCNIFHFFGGWTLFYVKISLIALKLKKKIIIHPMGLYEPWSLEQKIIKKKIAWHLYQQKLLLKADLIHCASTNEEKNLLKLNKNFKTIVLPFGIDDNFIKKNNIKKKINKRALFFSRLHKKKGLVDLIYIWNNLKNKDWILDIVGDGEDKEELKKIVFKKRFLNINFYDPIYKNKDKIKLFEKYDFFILPTKSENFGISILESLSRGLPVLTTDSTPWTSIKKYNAGWIVNKIQPELSINLKKIFRMKSNEFFIKSINSIKLAKKYKWSVIFKEYMKTYNQLLSS